MVHRDDEDEDAVDSRDTKDFVVLLSSSSSSTFLFLVFCKLLNETN